MRLVSLGVIFILVLAISVQSQNSEGGDRAQQLIEQARQRLGDSLLSTPEQVIEAHLAATGGRDAWIAVKSVLFEGRNVILSSEERPLVRYLDSDGQLFQAPPGATSHIMSDGATVYSVQGETRTPLERRWTPALKHLRLDNDLLVIDRDDVEYEFVGLEAYGTEPTVLYRVRRVYNDGYSEDLLFDVDSGLLRMIVEHGETSYHRALYEYREVGGVLVPHLRLTVFDGPEPPHVFLLDRVELNVERPEMFGD